MLKIIKSNYLYLIFLPIVSNAIFNIFNTGFINNLEKINLYDFFSTLLLFLFLLQAGIHIKDSLNLNTISFSITIYIFSFFVFDIILLFLTKSLSFNEIFVFVNLIWLIGIFYKKNFYSIFKLVFYYSILNLFNTLYLTKFTRNKNIIGDVEFYFYPHAKNIYENSYYFSVSNFITEGYPQFTSYIQALFTRFSFNIEVFEYFAPTTQIIFLISSLFFYELKISNKNKIFVVLIFSTLVVNSLWVQFLFTSSLMSEGIVSLFSAIIIYENFTSKRNQHLNFLALGILYFTKQFLSFISLLLVFYFLITNKNRKLALIGFSGLVLKELLFIFPFGGIKSSLHLSQIDIPQTLINIITLNNLKFENIILILKNIFLDKPLTLLIISLFLLIVNNLFFVKNLGINLIFIFIVFFNVVFIFLLYISAWQNMELESPIRFIWSFLHLKLVIVSLLIDRSQK